MVKGRKVEVQRPISVVEAAEDDGLQSLLIERIRERLEVVGLSGNEASIKAGLKLSFVNDVLGGRSKNPKRENLKKLADVLKCSVDYLYGEVTDPRADRVGVQLNRPGTLGADGFYSITHESDDLVETPWSTSPSVYAVALPDDTMSPRYCSGEVVLVDRSRPVTRGSYALIRLRDGRVAVREIKSIMPEHVVAGRLDGGAATNVPREDIDTLERVVSCAEQ